MRPALTWRNACLNTVISTIGNIVYNMAEAQKTNSIQNAGAAPQIRIEIGKEKFMPQPDAKANAGNEIAKTPEIFMEEKRYSCAEKLIGTYPDLKGRELEFDSWHFILENDKLIGDERVKEFLAWQYLVQKFYWRSFRYVEMILEKNESYFSEADKKIMTEIMVSQIMKGEMVASSVPLYSDVWKFLERNEDQNGAPKKSHFAEYVTDEHNRNALNTGFWDILKSTADPKKHRDACSELSILLNYGEFYRCFDFREGAKKAEQMPDGLDFGRLNNLNPYVRWYLVQEAAIERVFSDQMEQAQEIKGKLIAPVVHRLMMSRESEYDNDKKLISFFVNGEIIRSSAMQYQLGRAFEDILERGFGHCESYSHTYLRTCELAIIDLKPHVASVWEKVKKGIELDRVPEELRKYVPKETGEAYISGLKERIMAMKRFDTELFREWMGLKIDEDVPKSVHGLVRNKAFEVYFLQKPRPKGEILEILHYYGKGHVSRKLDAFLVMDCLFRRRWKTANEILMGYDTATQKETCMFWQGLDDYVKMHGALALDREGLSPKACYPSYNKIVEFRSRFPKLFREPQEPDRKPI